VKCRVDSDRTDDVRVLRGDQRRVFRFQSREEIQRAKAAVRRQSNTTEQLRSGALEIVGERAFRLVPLVVEIELATPLVGESRLAPRE
jgi:hypothetical protein